MAARPRPGIVALLKPRKWRVPKAVIGRRVPQVHDTIGTIGRSRGRQNRTVSFVQSCFVHGVGGLEHWLWRDMDQSSEPPLQFEGWVSATSFLADQQNKSSDSYQQRNQNTDDERNNWMPTTLDLFRSSAFLRRSRDLTRREVCPSTVWHNQKVVDDTSHRTAMRTVMAITKLVATASSKIRPMRDSLGVAIRGFLCRSEFPLSSRKQP